MQRIRVRIAGNHSPLATDGCTLGPRGACYFTTENNNCPQGSVLATATRNANIKQWAAQITAAGLPWLYWQVLPNKDPHVSLPLARSLRGRFPGLIYDGGYIAKL